MLSCLYYEGFYLLTLLYFTRVAKTTPRFFDTRRAYRFGT